MYSCIILTYVWDLGQNFQIMLSLFTEKKEMLTNIIK